MKPKKGVIPKRYYFKEMVSGKYESVKIHGETLYPGQLYGSTIRGQFCALLEQIELREVYDPVRIRRYRFVNAQDGGFLVRVAVITEHGIVYRYADTDEISAEYPSLAYRNIWNNKQRREVNLINSYISSFEEGRN